MEFDSSEFGISQQETGDSHATPPFVRLDESVRGNVTSSAQFREKAKGDLTPEDYLESPEAARLINEAKLRYAHLDLRDETLLWEVAVADVYAETQYQRTKVRDNGSREITHARGASDKLLNWLTATNCTAISKHCAAIDTLWHDLKERALMFQPIRFERFVKGSFCKAEDHIAHLEYLSRTVRGTDRPLDADQKSKVIECAARKALEEHGYKFAFAHIAYKWADRADQLENIPDSYEAPKLLRVYDLNKALIRFSSTFIHEILGASKLDLNRPPNFEEEIIRLWRIAGNELRAGVDRVDARLKEAAS